MSKLLSIIASALFLAYLVTEISTRFFAGDYFALLVIAFVLLTLNGFFIARMSANGQAIQSEPSDDRKGGRREQGGRGQRDSGRDDKPNKRKKPAAESNRPKPAAAAKPPADGEKGTVKWFNRSKGYGFIVRENGEEIFVHQRSIVADGDQRSRPVLRDGQAVQFIVTENERGVQAEQVYPLD